MTNKIKLFFITFEQKITNTTKRVGYLTRLRK